MPILPATWLMHNGTIKSYEDWTQDFSLNAIKKRTAREGQEARQKETIATEQRVEAKDLRCQQKIESIRIRSQQMSDAKDEQYTNQLKRVEKKCAKKLQKKEEQCKAKISGLKKRQAGEVDKLKRQVKRLKSTLEQI